MEKLHDDIWQAASGFAGVETSVRLFLTYGVHVGRMTLEQYVRASSEGLARACGLHPRKGAIAVGSEAALTIIDLDRDDVSRILWTGQDVVQVQAVGRATERARIEELFAGLVATLDLGPQAIGSPGASGLPVSTADPGASPDASLAPLTAPGG